MTVYLEARWLYRGTVMGKSPLVAKNNEGKPCVAYGRRLRPPYCMVDGATLHMAGSINCVAAISLCFCLPSGIVLTYVGIVFS